MSATTTEIRSTTEGLSGYLLKRLFVQTRPFLSLAIVSLALWAAYRTVSTIELANVVEQFQELPLRSVFLAFLITGISYLLTTGYDVVALHHIGRALSYKRVALASCLADAFGSNLGFVLITGGAIRYRIYAQAGLSALDIASVTTMYSLTSSLGVAFIAALAMLFGTPAASTLLIPEELRLALGVLVLGSIAAYVVVPAIRPVTIQMPFWSLRLPSAKTAAAQTLLGAIDLMLMSAVVYVLLPTNIGTDFFAYLGVFAAALVAGVISHVPGGIGVFESVMLVGLPEVPAASLLSAILMFRCTYYFVPLGFAAIVLAAYELSLQHAPISRARDTAMEWVRDIGPQVMAAIVFLAGVVLLFSCAVPASPERLAVMEAFVPLPVLEASHMIAGGAGVGLVIFARGLTRRLAAEHRYSIWLLAIGVAALLLKGLNIEGAVILVMVLAVLWIMRPEFQRQESNIIKGSAAEWAPTLTTILAVTVWLGMFSYKHVPTPHAFWWHLAYDAELPRFLRTTMAILAVAAGLTFVKLLRRAPPPDLPDAMMLAQARQIVEDDPDSRGHLALLGDKRFLFSESGHAFIMYGVTSTSWVALGDPIGARQEHERLIRAFHDLCSSYGGTPIFYLVDAANLPVYVDLGLSVLKVGEEARIALDRFTLRGAERAELCDLHARLRTQHLRLSIANSKDVPRLIPELKAVSDDWLAHTRCTERRFSRGFFDPAYVSNFPCAVVRNDKHILAFATLLVGAHEEEVHPDFIRHRRDAPRGIVEFLLLELMLNGRSRERHWWSWRGGRGPEYGHINLGLLPLADVEEHTLTPLWKDFGALLYPHTEYFADGNSYRRFVECLNPAYHAKYIALPRILQAPRILRNIAELVGRAD
ncbi:MAG: bifunctional lysylphosphatidylglycerol flippase/synthetase MprF [Gammaproteobacteria bacterium]